MKPLFDWLDERTGYRHALRNILDEKVLGGPSYAYVWGSLLLFLFVLQAVTGLFLGSYYSASATDAWASVAYIQDQVTLGWFVRGLHAYGASAMVIIVGIHLLQTALYGAYKKPREINWIVGVVMLCLVLGFSLTGYLLPWDQSGYWATKVATGIAGSAPFIGRAIQQLLQGGNEYGNLTLTRFFALHALLLPALLAGLVVVHLALFRRHGVTPQWRATPEALERRSRPFWPHQMFRDVAAAALLLLALVLAVVATGGVGLEEPADPASSFDARPDWYFRPLYQVLKYFHGPFEVVASLILPTVVLAFLFVLPFLDRRAGREPRMRLRWLGPLSAIAVGTLTLTGLSLWSDARDPAVQERLVMAEARGLEARALAAEHGVPPAGGVAVFDTDPLVAGRGLFETHCSSCHDGDERKGPEITSGYNSREWIGEFLAKPSGDRFFGFTEIDDMRPQRLSGSDREALVELVYAQTGAANADADLAEKGRELFDGGPCWDCHSIDWVTEGELGPNLARRGSVEMLVEFFADPGHARWFGDKNEMPGFGDKLSEDERRLVARYVVSLRDGDWN